jgi:glucose-specific phosphotransferase system IIA component
MAVTTRTLTVAAPIAGSVVALADVPDDVFAQEMLGPGVALDPGSSGVVDVLAPVDGVLSALHPHAFVIQVPDGRAVLVHLGLDTVRLLGETFTLDCCQGDEVRAGQLVVRWDVAAAVARGKPALCPVVALQAPPGTVHAADAGAVLASLDTLFTWDT